MGELKHGTVTVTTREDFELPAQAGKLSPEEQARIPRTPRGIRQACYDAADAMEKAGPSFVPPAGITPETLRTAGQRAEEADYIVSDLEVMGIKCRQGNLLLDANAYEQLRKVNDQVKVQTKHQPEFGPIFRDITSFFAKGTRHSSEPTDK